MASDLDLLAGLIRLNEKHRIIFAPPEIKQIKTEFGYSTCSFCNSSRVVLPITTLNLCANCAVNRFNLKDYRTNIIHSIFGKCQLCGRNYNVGWKVYSPPICANCASKIKPI